MDSDGFLTIPPEYLVLSEMSRFLPFSNQYISVNVGESCDTLAVQWMVIVVPISDIVIGTITVGFSKMFTSNYILKNCLQAS